MSIQLSRGQRKFCREMFLHWVFTTLLNLWLLISIIYIWVCFHDHINQLLDNIYLTLKVTHFYLQRPLYTEGFQTILFIALEHFVEKNKQNLIGSLGIPEKNSWPVLGNAALPHHIHTHPQMLPLNLYRIMLLFWNHWTLDINEFQSCWNGYGYENDFCSTSTSLYTLRTQ